MLSVGLSRRIPQGSERGIRSRLFFKPSILTKISIISTDLGQGRREIRSTKSRQARLEGCSLRHVAREIQLPRRGSDHKQRIGDNDKPDIEPPAEFAISDIRLRPNRIGSDRIGSDRIGSDCPNPIVFTYNWTSSG